MFYTRLTYDEFVDSANKDIEEAATLGEKSVTIDIPKEYFDAFLKDVKIAGYKPRYPDDVYDDQHRIELVWNDDAS